jgi:hypothetical protein
MDECIICFDEPVNISTPHIYLECCGKPICAGCKLNHEQNDYWGMGCPCCRSTLGMVYVCIDLAHMWHVNLRLNGNELKVLPSERTIRRYLNQGASSYQTFVKNPRTLRSEDQLSKSLVFEAVLSVSAFLEHECIRCPALRKFLEAQCVPPKTCWRYALYWSILPPHPDD